jgi:hypothetical protein
LIQSKTAIAALAVLSAIVLAAASFWVGVGALVAVLLLAARRQISAFVVRWRPAVQRVPTSPPTRGNLMQAAGFAALLIVLVASAGVAIQAVSIRYISVPSFTPFKNYNVQVVPVGGTLTSFDITVTMDYDPSLSAKGSVSGASAQPVRLPSQRSSSSIGRGWLTRAFTIASPANLRVPIVLDNGTSVETPVCRSTCPPMTIELEQFPDHSILGPLTGSQQSASNVEEFQNETFLVSATDTSQDVSIEFVSDPWRWARPMIDPLLKLHSLGGILALVVGAAVLVIAYILKKLVDNATKPLINRIAAWLHLPHETPGA